MGSSYGFVDIFNHTLQAVAVAAVLGLGGSAISMHSRLTVLEKTVLTVEEKKEIIRDIQKLTTLVDEMKAHMNALDDKLGLLASSL